MVVLLLRLPLELLLEAFESLLGTAFAVILELAVVLTPDIAERDDCN